MDYCRRKTVGGVVDIIMVVVAAAAPLVGAHLLAPEPARF